MREIVDLTADGGFRRRPSRWWRENFRFTS